VENVRDGLVVVGADERIEFANRQVQSILGYSPEEIVGQPFSRLLTSESSKSALEIHEKGRRNEPVPQNADFKVVTRSGTVKDIEAYASKVPAEGGRSKTIVTFRV